MRKPRRLSPAQQINCQPVFSSSGRPAVGLVGSVCPWNTAMASQVSQVERAVRRARRALADASVVGGSLAGPRPHSSAQCVAVGPVAEAPAEPPPADPAARTLARADSPPTRSCARSPPGASRADAQGRPSTHPRPPPIPPPPVRQGHALTAAVSLCACHPRAAAPRRRVARRSGGPRPRVSSRGVECGRGFLRAARGVLGGLQAARQCSGRALRPSPERPPPPSPPHQSRIPRSHGSRLRRACGRAHTPLRAHPARASLTNANALLRTEIPPFPAPCTPSPPILRYTSSPPPVYCFQPHPVRSPSRPTPSYASPQPSVLASCCVPRPRLASRLLPVSFAYFVSRRPVCGPPLTALRVRGPPRPRRRSLPCGYPASVPTGRVEPPRRPPPPPWTRPPRPWRPPPPLPRRP